MSQSQNQEAKKHSNTNNNLDLYHQRTLWLFPCGLHILNLLKRFLMLILIGLAMKAILILNPLKMILNKSNHLNPLPIILLHWQGLSKYRHILIVQKWKGKFSFAETTAHAMRSPSLDLEVVIIRLVYIFERLCLVIDDNVLHVVC